MGGKNYLVDPSDVCSLFIEPNIERLPWSGCWIWMRACDEDGRGRFVYEGKSWLLSRLSYTLFVGPIPVGLLICHTCDIPGCVNPFHLFVGTHQDNVLDMVNKGRHKSGNAGTATVNLRKGANLVGELVGTAKLSEADVIEIRRLAETQTLAMLSERYGVSQTQISRIKNRKKWAHVN